AAMGDKNVGAAAGTVRYTANAVYASSLSFTTGISGNTLSGTSTSLGFLTETPANEYNFGAPVSDMSGTLAAGTFVTVAGYNPAAPTQLQTATQIGIANPNQNIASTKFYPVFYTPQVYFSFCVPSNPMILNYRLYAAVNLFNIRNCRNISGTVRELDPFAAPTDSTTGIPTIGAGGTITLPNANTYTPSQYHYSTLIDRAKQLVSTAQQMEALLLAALEKKDAENYAVLQAQQSLKVSNATVTVQQMQLQDARDGVQLAKDQWTKIDHQTTYYGGLLAEPINGDEQRALNYLWQVSDLEFGASAADALGAIGISNPASAIGSSLTALAS